jgi:hypothetical protein
MKLKINNFDKDSFAKRCDALKDIDFSLFLDAVPVSQEELSTINILVLQEPNEYFGLHSFAIANKSIFNAILTWNDWVLNNCSNAIFLPFGHTWFKKDQYTKDIAKSFQLSHLQGTLLKTYGHQLRHELYQRRNEITKIPLKFYETYGNRNDIEDARKGKEFVFGDSMFGIAIENTSHNGYFTEKILDCFLLKTVPLYWGCSSITDYFNSNGIMRFDNIDDIIRKANKLTTKDYLIRQTAIEENYKLALQYIDYEQNIINMLTEIFKVNGVLK